MESKQNNKKNKAKKQDTTYLLRLSKEHAAAVSEALEIAHRAAMGQWRIVCEHFEGKNGSLKEQRDLGLNDAADALQKILCPDLTPSGGYGYGSERTGLMGQLIYEVKKQLDYRRAWTEHPPITGQTLCSNRDLDKPCLFPSPVGIKPECIAENSPQPELELSGHRLAREIEHELGTSDIVEALRVIRELKAVASSKE